MTTPVVIDKTKMYGLLHEKDGSPVRRHVRFLKVGFGLPAGKDIHVRMRHDAQKPWVIELGKLENNQRIVQAYTFATKEEVRKAYVEMRKTAIDRKFPTKFPYFTFSRLSIDGNYMPDFDAIEQHGAVPNELDVVFLTNDPFEHAYQAWTAANLKCEGDGLNARRRIDWAQNDGERELAAHAKAQGLDFFPILGKCFTAGCPFPKPQIVGGREKPPVCKPHGRLYYQLTNSPRIGGTCTYDTTGFRSISQLFSCIEQIKQMTGNGDASRGSIAGIPLKLVLRPYKASHNGQTSVQYGVSLEFRATNAIELARLLNQHTADFRVAAQSRQIVASTRQISAPVTLDNPGDGEDVDPSELTEALATATYQEEAFPSEEAEAAAMTDEFYGDFDESGEDTETDQGREDSRRTMEEKLKAVQESQKLATESAPAVGSTEQPNGLGGAAPRDDNKPLATQTARQGDGRLFPSEPGEAKPGAFGGKRS